MMPCLSLASKERLEPNRGCKNQHEATGDFLTPNRGLRLGGLENQTLASSGLQLVPEIQS